jgi:hypothetical protein
MFPLPFFLIPSNFVESSQPNYSSYEGKSICEHNTSWVLQLGFVTSPSQERHMQLVTHELLNPCRFTHLITKDI